MGDLIANDQNENFMAWVLVFSKARVFGLQEGIILESLNLTARDYHHMSCYHDKRLVLVRSKF
jgi:hypothetical protein